MVCKLGWWKTAPWDVCAYAAGHSGYPTESTLDQLYDFAEFDAYRELGWSSVDMAIDKGALPACATARQPQGVRTASLQSGYQRAGGRVKVPVYRVPPVVEAG